MEIDLELTVALSCREVANSHDFGVEPMVRNGFKNKVFGYELRIYIFVLVDVLPQPQVLLGELHIGTWHVVDAQSSDAGRRDVNEL